MNRKQTGRYDAYNLTYGNRPELFGAGSPTYSGGTTGSIGTGSGAGGSGGGFKYDIPSEALSDEKFARMIEEAEKYLGMPYVWGGSSPSTSFDCSGFVCWVINNCGNGWSVGRTTANGLRGKCSYVSPGDAKPGDLIFFEKTYNTTGASHVGIYVGNGMMIHCGDPISYTSMLNDENIPVPSVYNKENKAYGKETTYTIAPVILWDSSRVWKILTAYVYTGAMVLGKTKTLISGKSIVRTVPKGQQYITEGTHEAIVSREEFEKAQLVIKSNSHKVLMGSVDFPLKGKVRCGNCRRVMAHNFKQVVPTFWCREGLELVGQTQCTSEIFQVSDIESAVFQALKKELSLLDSLYGDIQKEEQALKEAHKKANRRKTLMEQELKNLKGEKMRMYEEYAAGTLPLDTYKQKKQECDRRISEVQEQIEQSKAEESAESVVPGTVRAAAEQAENFLNGTRLTAGMVSAFIENVFVHDGGRIVVRFKYEQSIQNAVKALHTD